MHVYLSNMHFRVKPQKLRHEFFWGKIRKCNELKLVISVEELGCDEIDNMKILDGPTGVLASIVRRSTDRFHNLIDRVRQIHILGWT